MNWENRDINVVKQTGTPKFSKPDDIKTPLRLFGSLFDDVLVDMIVGYNKHCRVIESLMPRSDRESHAS